MPTHKEVLTQEANQIFHLKTQLRSIKRTLRQIEQGQNAQNLRLMSLEQHKPQEAKQRTYSIRYSVTVDNIKATSRNEAEEKAAIWVTKALVDNLGSCPGDVEETNGILHEATTDEEGYN